MYIVLEKNEHKYCDEVESHTTKNAFLESIFTLVIADLQDLLSNGLIKTIPRIKGIYSSR